MAGKGRDGRKDFGQTTVERLVCVKQGRTESKIADHRPGWEADVREGHLEMKVRGGLGLGGWMKEARREGRCWACWVTQGLWESLNGFEPRDMFEGGRVTAEEREGLATQTFCVFGEYDSQREVTAETQRRLRMG